MHLYAYLLEIQQLQGWFISNISSIVRKKYFIVQFVFTISSAVRLNKYSKLNFAFYFSFKAQPSKHSSWWGRLEEDFYLRLQKTSWRRLQYVLIKTNIFVLAKHLQDVFKTSSRRFEGIFKISLRHLQDILQRCLQDSSRRTIRLNCLPRSHFWEIFRSM